MKTMLLTYFERHFKLSVAGSTIRTEIVAGLTTFLAMSYIIFVNPTVLGMAHIPDSAVFTATCLVAIVGSLLVGLFANYPIAIAPGMAMNGYFTYIVVLKMHCPWQLALGAVLVSGIFFLLLTLFKLRQWIIAVIPKSIGIAMTVGIGLFIAIIALKNAGIIVSDPGTLVALGSIKSIPVLLSFLGFFVIVVLDHYRVPGAILIGIVSVTVLSLLLGDTHFYGIAAMPPSLSPTLWHFSLDGLWSQSGVEVVATFLLITFFDTSGTVIALLNITNEIKIVPNQFSRVLIADSIATISAGLLGSSSASTFVESAVGIRSGGRTGLTAVVVAALFAIALFFSPLMRMVPSFAPAPALLFIACMMLRSIVDLHWDDLTESIPAVLTMMMIPFSFSISSGVGIGFISFVVLKVCCGKWCDLNPITIVIAALFVVYFMAT